MQKTIPEEWFLIAREDLTAAKILCRDGTALRPAFFLLQQATEKALKGFQVFHGKLIPRTHDLITLITLCADLDADFAQFRTQAAQLNPYATYFRYPEDPFAFPCQQTLENHIKTTHLLFNLVMRKISSI